LTHIREHNDTSSTIITTLQSVYFLTSGEVWIGWQYELWWILTNQILVYGLQWCYEHYTVTDLCPTEKATGSEVACKMSKFLLFPGIQNADFVADYIYR
jgi:hypothetical protein